MPSEESRDKRRLGIVFSFFLSAVARGVSCGRGDYVPHVRTLHWAACAITPAVTPFSSEPSN